MFIVSELLEPYNIPPPTKPMINIIATIATGFLLFSLILFIFFNLFTNLESFLPYFVIFSIWPKIKSTIDSQYSY